MKRRTVGIPNYPSELLIAGNFHADKRTAQRCLAELTSHYRIPSLAAPTGTQTSKEQALTFKEQALLWRHLAMCLAKDFVPAFRVRKKGGAPRQQHTRVPISHRHAHEARLVQMVNEIQSLLKSRGSPSTRVEAFKQVIRHLKTNPAPGWRFGAYRKASSFSQAWKAIPADVKKRPEKYLPPRADLAAVNLSEADSLSVGLGKWFVSTEASLWSVLPSLPSEGNAS